MQVNSISVISCQNNNLFSKQKANNSNLLALPKTNSPQINMPSSNCFYPSFGNLVKFPTSKISVFGAGGHLFNGRLHVREIIENLFKMENISVYDPNIQKIKNFGYNILSKEGDVFNSALYLLSPSGCHSSQIIEAVKNAKSKNIKGVFIDKPMCVSQEQLQEIEQAAKMSKIPLYNGDHYYFNNLAGLRLMGVDMPSKESIKINFDNTKNKKFTQCINNAEAYFKLQDIKSITSKLNEKEVDALVSRPWYRKPGCGGGVLLDLQLHVFNLLNIMGLKLTEINGVRGLKYPYSEKVFSNLSSKNPINQKNLFDVFKKGEIEDGAITLGKINGNIPTMLESIRYAPNNEKYLKIKSQNEERIIFHVTSSEKRVQLVDKNNELRAEACVPEAPYYLMLKNAQENFSGKQDDNFLSLLFNAQKGALEQIFKIKDKMGI